jgi:hypothetical protein
MQTLKTAKAYAQNLANMQGKPYVVVKLPLGHSPAVGMGVVTPTKRHYGGVPLNEVEDFTDLGAVRVEQVEPNNVPKQTIKVCFERDDEEGSDLEFARKNFPKLNAAEALRNQLIYELEENTALVGSWVFDRQNKANTRFHFVFEWPGRDYDSAKESLHAQLQWAYDRYGVNGFFKWENEPKTYAVK